MQQAPPSWLFLLLIPLVIGIRIWRARRAASASDFWFEPEGDQFVYHPFGRFGSAYLVTAATRDAIRLKLKTFTQIVAVALAIAALGPITLLSLDMELYLAWRPWIMPIRLGLVLTVIAVGILWRFVVIRPLYQGSAVAERRISSKTIHAKRAAQRSWWGLGLTLVVVVSLAGLFLFAAYVKQNAAFAAYGILCVVAALFTLRTVMTKRRLQGSAIPKG